MTRIPRLKARFHALALGTLLACAFTPTAHAEQAKVTIAIQYGYAYLPVTVAEKQGLFRKHASALGEPDAAFEIKRISGAAAINDALISANVDIGGYGLYGTLTAWQKTRNNLDIRALCALVAGDNGFYVNDPSIKSIADFKPGDKIAVTAPNGQQAVLLQMLAEQQFGEGNAHRMDNLMVALPHPDALASLVNKAGIKGYIGPNPYSYILDHDPSVTKLFDFSKALNMRMTSGVLATTGKFVKSNPHLAKAVVDAIAEADEFIRSNPRQAAQLYLDSEPSKLTLDQTQDMLSQVTAEWGVQPQGVMHLAEFMTRTGALKEPLANWQQVFFDPVAQGEGN
ncbi:MULTISPECIES: ABC transporter substrate-binding protein [unclassified Pseudomonas]|uniref:ABC transporter substrate-binding protein n=1 Tax=unclassified Pseudomonas TaxID=196821 RepID=UPI000BCEA0C6|nr:MULTISPECIES: ABC transporter substrate-binding protein [unclassified Pseudomonas]PVZ20528.1 NitT/TauT family transport system substrate-binding protein [Pseudomonas sp. URIL14HWK12:I12]PVZ27594.1 NitT/TauT family transport system substrate-binding protein [Pseudomonas sp. URIL14HWK12:I10]PVZ38483.1 NitT/TauT family transport system substrate-binding protein [Pseudomonas sp. URIL14HWK12:I11]SNZ03177.1 NitT/TauT family transport system substrate-binding protein [Pseudomonas sp. URIL14HWK12:I9